MKKKNDLFPVHYNGKDYYEKDCASIFLAFYSCKEALNWEMGVYMSGGISVYPDGTMNEY